MSVFIYNIKMTLQGKLQPLFKDWMAGLTNVWQINSTKPCICMYIYFYILYILFEILLILFLLPTLSTTAFRERLYLCPAWFFSPHQLSLDQNSPLSGVSLLPGASLFPIIVVTLPHPLSQLALAADCIIIEDKQDFTVMLDLQYLRPALFLTVKDTDSALLRFLHSSSLFPVYRFERILSSPQYRIHLPSPLVSFVHLRACWGPVLSLLIRESLSPGAISPLKAAHSWIVLTTYKHIALYYPLIAPSVEAQEGNWSIFNSRGRKKIILEKKPNVDSLKKSRTTCVHILYPLS